MNLISICSKYFNTFKYNYIIYTDAHTFPNEIDLLISFYSKIIYAI